MLDISFLTSLEFYFFVSIPFVTYILVFLYAYFYYKKVAKFLGLSFIRFNFVNSQGRVLNFQKTLDNYYYLISFKK